MKGELRNNREPHCQEVVNMDVHNDRRLSIRDKMRVSAQRAASRSSQYLPVGSS